MVIVFWIISCITPLASFMFKKIDYKYFMIISFVCCSIALYTANFSVDAMIAKEEFASLIDISPISSIPCSIMMTCFISNTLLLGIRYVNKYRGKLKAMQQKI